MSTTNNGSNSMKILKVGDKAKAACETCQAFTGITYQLRDVPFSDGSGLTKNILAGVCDVCGAVTVIPHQSTPAICSTLERQRKAVESRLPAHMLDILNLVSVEVDGKTWPGVANIGVRPTVAGDGSAHLEVHLLDYAGDLYGRRLTVAFHHKLRDEQRFASLEALKTAINADVAAARAYWLGQPLKKSLK